jgi:hypothetical protein
MTSQLRLTERPGAQQLTAGRGRGPGATPPALPQRACRCPVSGCREQIDASRLMCRGHWYRLPKELRDLVWATWRSGAGALSPEHRQAVRRAITAS